MPRPLQRTRLESGLKLDLNALIRRGYIQTGAHKGHLIEWTNRYSDEPIALGFVTADMTDSSRGAFRIQVGNLDQYVALTSQPRHFGGLQWYFLCPITKLRASVLWRPPGARDFACRQRWDGRVAYGSQFRDRINRAHDGKARINACMCAIGVFDADFWEFPPKPKRMRWATYYRAEEKFDRYQASLDYGLSAAVARLAGMSLISK